MTWALGNDVNQFHAAFVNQGLVYAMSSSDSPEDCFQAVLARSPKYTEIPRKNCMAWTWPQATAT